MHARAHFTARISRTWCMNSLIINNFYAHTTIDFCSLQLTEVVIRQQNGFLPQI